MIPKRLMRTLTLQTRTTGTDRYGDTIATGWTNSTITGRIDQFLRREVTDAGREASVTEWRLLTNSPNVAAASRIVDGALVFEVDGRPAPVHAAAHVHHYEASLTLVEG